VALAWGVVLAAGAGMALAVAAGGFTPHATQPPVTHPVLAPGTCAVCHGDFDSAHDTEPYPTWAGSMMANAARDPIFWAALDVANHDVAGVGDFCLRCHVPTGWLAGRSEPPGGSTDGCGLVGDIDAANNDFEGVSCHLCHRMMENPSPPPGQQPLYFANGEYWVDDGDCTDPGSGPCRRGPYDYLPGGDIPPPHEWAYSAYHVAADICGNCHNVTSPAVTLIDENGVNTGIPYPIERTFKEWQQSAYAPAGAAATPCQGCHMPLGAGDPLYACSLAQNNRAGELPVHRFVGGNAWIPRVLRDEYPNLGRTDSYDATIAWAQDMLQNHSAAVALAAPARVDPDQGLAVAVQVTNLAGHKLPTGYPEGRRMWLDVTVRDGDGQLVWESGAYDAATGVLSEDPQIKVYRTERGVWDRNGTGVCDLADLGGTPVFHFVLNDCIALDNRIPPLGFTGGSDPETRPVGYSYPETSGGSGVLVNHDVTSYQVPLPPGTPSPLTVEATLRYQTASKEYVDFLRDEAVAEGFPDDCIPRSGAGAPSLSRGEILHDLWSTHDRSPPVAMGSASAEVEVVEAIFLDGFESGDTSAWSGTPP
jgi:hypothetical protein